MRADGGARRENQKSVSVEALAAGLFAGRPHELSRLFAQYRARPPFVLWSPSRIELLLSGMERLFDTMSTLPKISGLPLADSFKVEDAPDIADYLVVTDVDISNRELRYAYCGAEVARNFGRSFAGARLSTFSDHISKFFMALYHAAMVRRESYLSEHEPPSGVFISRWWRYGVPMVDRQGAVSRFVSYTYPDNPMRSVLDALPAAAVVSAPDGTVWYANPAARALFGLGADLRGIVMADLVGDAGPVVDCGAAGHFRITTGEARLNRQVLTISIFDPEP